MKNTISTIFFLLFTIISVAQDKYTISGYVQDEYSGAERYDGCDDDADHPADAATGTAGATADEPDDGGGQQQKRRVHQDDERAGDTSGGLLQ